MKVQFALGALLLAVVAQVSCGAAEKPAGKSKLLHVVSFKYKPEATPEQRKQLEAAFRALEKKIPQIKDYKGGVNMSTEGKDKGFHFCAVLEFKSEQDLATYAVHPDHKAFGAMVGPIVADVFVVDFWE